MEDSQSIQCANCKKELQGDDSYCSRCGLPVKSSNKLSDFEVGQIAALETIKGDIWERVRRWAALLPLLSVIVALGLGLLAWFGVGEVISNRAKSAAENHLHSLRDYIQNTSNTLFKTVAEVEYKLGEDRKKLQSELDGIRETGSEIAKEQNELRKEIKALRGKRDEIASILGETSFVTALHKLRYELYRVQDIEIRYSIIFSYDDLNLAFKFHKDSHLSVYFSKYEDDTGTWQKIEFTTYDEPTFYKNSSENKVKIINRAKPFEKFSDRFIGQKIDRLNIFDTMRLTSSASSLDNPLFSEDFTVFLSAIKEVRLQFYINRILVMEIPFQTPSFALERKERYQSYSTQLLPVANFFQNVSTRYEQAISRAHDDQN